MYVPIPFRVDDTRRLQNAISDYPLATLIRNGTEGPVVAYAPLVCETEGGRIIRLIGHIAKANPFWRTAHDPKIVAVFSGPDADGYVSASLYPSKQEHGKVVPTWNYIGVEVAGRMFVATEREKLPFYIRRPTEEKERYRDPPWSIDDFPARI
jgi:transcriptional regulator